MLSFEELVLHSVVLELLELLEGLERPRAHGLMILPYPQEGGSGDRLYSIGK